MEPQRSRDQYTVGWIAALDCELTAAISMLEVQHEQPHDFDRGPNDDNVYIWGEINQHHIVIACLKAGVYGTTSAATTAMRLLSAFPNVRFGLMVGIGAGIPQRGNKPDIRLGDVVISEPDSATGGVFLYDLMKAKSGGVSEPKGFLNAPPGILLKSLTRLRAEHKLKGMDIQRHLDRITPNMVEPDDDTPGFVHQGSENDRLFKADYLHVDGEDCENCENCSPTEQVKRKERATRPRFHYGIIASGNTLVKDAMHREDLVQRIPGRILCLEMEAAGLMNDFPCLVIRGICDYADSHKNDQWQPYAAVTAAAYAREFLHFVPREEVEKTAKATEIMQGIATTLEANHKITIDTNHRVKQANMKEWLAPADPEINWATARSQCYSSTGQWFLDSEEFASWKERPGSFLWLHGRPGSGKTILSSTIIDHLRCTELPSTTKNAVLFYYFDFKDSSKRSTSNFIRTILMQLSAANDDCWNKLYELHEFHNGTSQPSDNDLIKTFESISANFDHIMIVLDALDEAIKAERAGMIQKVIGLLNTPSANIHLIATSRREHDIERALDRADPIAVDLARDAVYEDITRYIRARIRESEKSPKLQQRWEMRPDVQEEIETTLSEKADGMFRWAACQLDALEDCVDLRTLRNTLKDLPTTLDETYARIIQKIGPNQKDSAVRLLQLLAFSERPLDVREAVDAYAVDPSESPAFSEIYRLPVPSEIVQVCGALVTIPIPNEYHQTLHLAHFSVKEYLTSTRLQPEYLQPQFDPVRAHSSIARICLGYISSVLAEGNPYEDFWMLYTVFPFLEYAAEHWTNHVKHAEDDEDLFNIILDFFQQPVAYCTWAVFFMGDNFSSARWFQYGIPLRWTPPPVQVCTYSRLTKTTLKLLDYPEYCEPPSLFDSPELRGEVPTDTCPFLYRDFSGEYSLTSLLYVASSAGATAIVRHLIAGGAQAHERYGFGGTALDVACSKHNAETVEALLLHTCVPAQTYPQYIQSAMEELMSSSPTYIQTAYCRSKWDPEKTYESYTAIMLKLLAACEHIDTSTTCSDTALLGALSIADLAMIQTFITKGGSFLEVVKRMEMLEHLTNQKLSRIRELLRQNDMEHIIFESIREAEEEGYWSGRCASDILVNSPNEELFALVLGLSLSPESFSTCVQSSKPLPPDPAHREILPNGRRPCQSFTDAEFSSTPTPLRAWAEKGRADLVELLLRAAADVDATGEDGSTAAHHAALNDNLEALKVLVRYGADLGIKNRDGKTPYMSAMHPGEEWHDDERRNKAPCMSVVDWIRAEHPGYAVEEGSRIVT